MAGARLLDLDAFVPRGIEVQIGGVVHRIPGSALTVELVIGLQELGEDAREGKDSALPDILDLLGAVTAQAQPPLNVRDVPTASLAALASFLVESSGAIDQDEEEPERPTAARRRASRTTQPSRQPRAKK